MMLKWKINKVMFVLHQHLYSAMSSIFQQNAEAFARQNQGLGVSQPSSSSAAPASKRDREEDTSMDTEEENETQKVKEYIRSA
jgi:hypothetical protein